MNKEPNMTIEAQDKLQAALSKNSALPELLKFFSEARTVLIAAHYHPDADAYGSSCGLALGLRNQGLTTVVVNESGILPRYDFIPGVNEVIDALPAGFQPEAVVACDCGDVKRLGDMLGPQIIALHPLCNLDHHISNNHFGDLNIVRPDASSTSEIVFDLLLALEQHWNKKLIDKNVAQCLFAGLSADTGSFRYSSTNQRTFAIAQELVVRGAVPHLLAQAMFSQEEFSAVKLQAEAMSKLELKAGNSIAIVRVEKEMMLQHLATREDTEALVERARDIRGVKIAVFIREDEGFLKVSMRSKSPELDVAKVAASFGGGGHYQAAGFRWKGDRQQLESSLFPMLESLVKSVKI